MANARKRTVGRREGGSKKGVIEEYDRRTTATKYQGEVESKIDDSNADNG